MVLGDKDSYIQKKEIWAPTYTIHKNKFKVDKDLNISYGIIRVLEENIGRKISDIPRSNIFTNMSPRARDIKEKINKWDLFTIKSFCIAKENSIKMKRESIIWENIFVNDTSDKGLISKMYKDEFKIGNAVVWVLYIFWRSNPCLRCHWQICFSIWLVLFSF